MTQYLLALKAAISRSLLPESLAEFGHDFCFGECWCGHQQEGSPCKSVIFFFSFKYECPSESLGVSVEIRCSLVWGGTESCVTDEHVDATGP